MTLKLTKEKKQQPLAIQLSGPSFYRALETDKIVGLKRHKQNYDIEIELSNEACSELTGGNITLKIIFNI